MNTLKGSSPDQAGNRKRVNKPPMDTNHRKESQISQSFGWTAKGLFVTGSRLFIG
ncbi:MAG: hypothetical protein KZQ99_09715 [Candidatus Thiodiazotropha sp. (ex Dulcina madagascariensis)]|nr:hypothetical protein [Candidatus Thiodiazotropha sp. (ex Dulcina madagascariensis)]